MQDGSDKKTISEIIARHRGHLGSLMSILHEIHRAYGHLSSSALRQVADETGRSIVDVYGVVASSDALDTIQVRSPTRCSWCNRSLIDPDNTSHGMPTCRVSVVFGQEEGWFQFVARPGICAPISEHPLPASGEVNFFCPHCSAELVSPQRCSLCGAPMAPMIDARNRLTTICTSRRCRRQQAGVSTDEQPRGKESAGV